MRLQGQEKYWSNAFGGKVTFRVGKRSALLPSLPARSFVVSDETERHCGLAPRIRGAREVSWKRERPSNRRPLNRFHKKSVFFLTLRSVVAKCRTFYRKQCAARDTQASATKAPRSAGAGGSRFAGQQKWQTARTCFFHWGDSAAARRQTYNVFARNYTHTHTHAHTHTRTHTHTHTHTTPHSKYQF